MNMQCDRVSFLHWACNQLKLRLWSSVYKRELSVSFRMIGTVRAQRTYKLRRTTLVMPMNAINWLCHWSWKFPLKSLAMLVTKPSRYVQGNHGHSFVRLWSRIKTQMLACVGHIIAFRNQTISWQILLVYWQRGSKSLTLMRRKLNYLVRRKYSVKSWLPREPMM